MRIDCHLKLRLLINYSTNSFQFRASVHSFDPEEEIWFPLPAIIGTGKELMVAVTVPEIYVPCVADF